jgi:hypothetical protein
MDRDDLSSRPLVPPVPLAPLAPLVPAPAALATGFLLDLAAVALFVLIGRHSHGESDAADGILSTAWPFAVGVVGGYVPVVPLRWPVAAAHSGLMVVFKTVVLGMILRAAVQDDAPPVSFVLVTVVALSGFMLGWRLLLASRLPLFRPLPAVVPTAAGAPSIL